MILHSDLPLLTAHDLRALIATDTAIAPSSDGGTSAIMSVHEIEFAYGASSFSRHLPRLQSPTVVARTGLLHDVDAPRDLEAARKHSRGQWIDNVLG